MDKFGIFNLLSSLSKGENKNFSEDGGEKNNASPDLSALVGNLLGGNNPQKKEVSSPSATPKEFKPLQNSMLTTMAKHDEIIKRIKEKNKL